ncbi:hypothetical protein ACEPAG_9703 [Sanghuangporus baumii]
MVDVSTRLQIPDASPAGPSQASRSGSGAARPASTQVYPTSTSNSVPVHSASSQASRKRASHQVTTSQPEREEPAGYRDVYSHPAAVAYAAAHPRRTIPKFGPYLLLQTLGEGEFGKVKLGLHSQWGEEVAVKLIRRGNIDTAVRMSKVEREIEVLRTIKHPNIVRLYDVIETDKYIGIILEYASGGELFDHILAHRYLKEKDACKLFAQLISGVWYIHQKKIVHRDLKLENLLLDRHRNVIITDFGFANRFEHRADDLMQTSCGSPCYAAPELVISEGLYVGSAVDIWSCGVILYAMLAGYLPFDDDPANPDGDNINLLYRYIVNTPLTFPEYVSQEARDLLSIMLVPDPSQRADLKTIMAHHWLKPYAHLFNRSVQDLERLAMEQHQMKRLAYQRQMKQQAAAAAAEQQKMQRSQSARVEAPQAPSHGHRTRPQHPPSAMNEEYLYESNPDESLFASPALPPVKRHPVSIAVGGSSQTYEDDPFGPPPALPTNAVEETVEMTEQRRARQDSTPSRSSKKQAPPTALQPIKSGSERRKDRQRHTIQLEYGGEQDENRPAPSTKTRQKSKSREHAHREEPQFQPQPQELETQDKEIDIEEEGPVVTVSDPVIPDESQMSPGFLSKSDVTPKASKPLPQPPTPLENGPFAISTADSQQESISTSEGYKVPPPELSVTPTSPPRNEFPPSSFEARDNSASGSMKSNTGSSKSGHRRGMSVDKIVGKLWGGSQSETESNMNGVKARRPSDASVTPVGTKRIPSNASKRPSTLDVSTASATPASSVNSKASVHSSVSAVKKEEKKSRRNTLTVMVEPLSKRISQRGKSRATPAEDTHVQVNGRTKEKPSVPPLVVPKTRGKAEEDAPETPRFSRADRHAHASAIPASTSKASRVMQWFRQRSKSRAGSPSGDYEDRAPTPTAEKQRSAVVSSASEPLGPEVIVDTPRTPAAPRKLAPSLMGRSASTHVTETTVSATPQHNSFVPRTMKRLSNMVGSPQPTRLGYNKNAIRLHHGAVDQTTVTTGSPPDVMAQVTKVLLDMGLEVQQESEYKYRCIRTKRKKVVSGTTVGGVTAFTMVGTAASNGIDKRGLPQPSQSSFSSTSGMLKGLLMRRQSSQVSAHPSIDTDAGDARETSRSVSREKLSMMPSPPSHEPIYGDRTEDQGDEVRFSVELTRIDGLQDTFSIDIRRLKGNLRSYKFLYDTLRERIDFSR